MCSHHRVADLFFSCFRIARCWFVVQGLDSVVSCKSALGEQARQVRSSRSPGTRGNIAGVRTIHLLTMILGKGHIISSHDCSSRINEPHSFLSSCYGPQTCRTPAATGSSLAEKKRSLFVWVDDRRSLWKQVKVNKMLLGESVSPCHVPMSSCTECYLRNGMIWDKGSAIWKHTQKWHQLLWNVLEFTYSCLSCLLSYPFLPNFYSIVSV